jgi:hypothetical protein
VIGVILILTKPADHIVQDALDFSRIQVTPASLE